MSRLQVYQWSQFIEINLLKIRQNVSLLITSTFLLIVQKVYVFFVLRGRLEICLVLNFSEVWDLVDLWVMVQNGDSFCLFNQLIPGVDFAQEFISRPRLLTFELTVSVRTVLGSFWAINERHWGLIKRLLILCGLIFLAYNLANNNFRFVRLRYIFLHLKRFLWEALNLRFFRSTNDDIWALSFQIWEAKFMNWSELRLLLLKLIRRQPFNLSL